MHLTAVATDVAAAAAIVTAGNEIIVHYSNQLGHVSIAPVLPPELLLLLLTKSSSPFASSA